jgi:hypothetical protein
MASFTNASIFTWMTYPGHFWCIYSTQWVQRCQLIIVYIVDYVCGRNGLFWDNAARENIVYQKSLLLVNEV